MSPRAIGDATSAAPPTHSASTRLAWLTPSLRAATGASVASGLAAFSVTALIGDVAADLGAPGAGTSLQAQIGLTGTTLGVALATIRSTSLLALPGTALADRFGRARMLLVTLAAGLSLTALGGLATGFWWWVLAVACARPFLSTVNGIAGVVAAEETTSRYRSWGLVLIGAGYGLGAGIVPILRAVMDGISYRLIAALILVPLVLLPGLARMLHEPRVYEDISHEPARRRALGAVPAPHRFRLILLLLATGAVSLATGPGFTYVVVYGEQVLGVTRATTGLLVLAAGPTGGLGLLLGRWLGDRVGRRPTAIAALLVTAVGLVLAYSGSDTMLLIGYLVAIAAAATFGTPAAALAAEVFPTQIRATVAGWVSAAGVVGAVAGLAAFGALADVTGTFSDAARILAVGVSTGAIALLGLPETRGLELDEL